MNVQGKAWAIYGVHVKLYWSCEDGWVDRNFATLFTWNERRDTHIPFGGVWRKIGLLPKMTIGFIQTRPWIEPIKDNND
jgi:hypothetical protein